MTKRSPSENPFRIGGVVAGPFFTDRDDERRRIRRALTEPQSHLLIYGPRRMGKTSTLVVVREELTREGRHVMLADLSTASTVADITTRLLQAASRELGRRWPDFLASLVQRVGVRLGLEADPGTGLILPSLDVSLRQAPLEEQRATLAGALDAIEQVAAAKRAHVGVILDEFQEIHRFGGEAAEAHLRGVIQHHRRVSYVLAGSDERLIQAMTGRGRPFYKLLEPLQFGAMAPAHLAGWIDLRLRGAGVRSKGVGEAVVAVAGPRTRDVVQLARAVFDAGRTGGMADGATLEEAFRGVVVAEEAPLRALWEGLTPLQQNVLRALAVRAAGLTTGATRRGFSLGAQGAATKAAQTLVARDLLVKDETGYRFDNPFMRGWVILYALPDVGRTLPVTHVP